MKLRSLLYVPANSERFIAKAHERGADAIILDLEDSVPEGEKDSARKGLAEAVQSVGQNGASVFVRINSGARQNDDAVAACRAGAFGLYVPKAHDALELAALGDLLARIEAETGRGETKLVALIEDPGAVLDARPLARAPRVIALTTGSEDFAAAMGAEPTPDVLRFPKLMVHLAAKAEGKLSLGLLASIADYSKLDAIKAAAEEARTVGFDGASCVHPSAVPILNAAFSPSADQIDWAHRVIAGAADAQAKGAGAFTIDGKMVDAPVVARARDILDRAAG